MGTFNVSIEVAASRDGPFETIEAMVDTGSTFTMAPTAILRRLGIEPTRRVRFTLADGSRIERDAGAAVIRIGDVAESSPVVFGADGVSPLLGAVTLETLLLSVDPVSQRLVPVDAYMLGSRQGNGA